MTGETNLKILLREMRPEIKKENYVFCTLPFDLCKISNLETLNPVCSFQEAEGTTLILEKNNAEKERLDYTCISKMITLHIHSSLAAVGFLAAITKKLAKRG